MEWETIRVTDITAADSSGSRSHGPPPARIPRRNHRPRRRHHHRRNQADTRRLPSPRQRAQGPTRGHTNRSDAGQPPALPRRRVGRGSPPARRAVHHRIALQDGGRTSPNRSVGQRRNSRNGGAGQPGQTSAGKGSERASETACLQAWGAFRPACHYASVNCGCKSY